MSVQFKLVFLANGLLFRYDLFFRLLAYEGVEVINPDGGKEDAEEEAQRGRWKDEVYYLLLLLRFFFLFLISTFAETYHFFVCFNRNVIVTGR